MGPSVRFQNILNLCAYLSAALLLASCGVIDASLIKGLESASLPDSSSSDTFKIVSLTADKVVGRDKYVGFNDGIPGGTTIDSNGNFVTVESDGIYVFDDDGDLVSHIALSWVTYPTQIVSNTHVAVASDGSYFIGGPHNGSSTPLMKVSSTGVVTQFPLVRTGYGFTDVKIIRRSNNTEEVHVTVPIYTPVTTWPQLANLVTVYDLNGNYIDEYGVEADKPAVIAQAPSGNIYIMPQSSSQIFVYSEARAYLGSLDFAVLDQYNEMSFAPNGDLVLIKEGLTADAGLYRYQVPSLTLVDSVTTADDPTNMDYPLELLTNGENVELTMGSGFIRTRMRYEFASGAYSKTGELRSRGTQNGEFDSVAMSVSIAYNAITSDAAENLYAFDQGNNRVQSFTKAGVYRFQSPVNVAGITSYDDFALAITSTHRLVAINWKDAPSNNLYLQIFDQTGAQVGVSDTAWAYDSRDFIGIDDQDRLWFKVFQGPLTLLVGLDLTGVTQETIDITDTTTHFGEANLDLFRVIGSKIYSISLVTYKNFVSEFDGTTQRLMSDDEMVAADIIAGLSNSLKKSADGSIYMKALRNDMTTYTAVVINQNNKVVRRLDSPYMDANSAFQRLSTGLWAQTSFNRLVQLKW
jgi:hypothetical protein